MENLHTKLFKLQTEIGSISKDSKNPFFNSKYFDINSLLKQLNPILKKHNLLLLQPITGNQVRSVIYDLEGASVESSIKLPKNLDAQKLGSAITYFRRYTLKSLLALQAGDDDGNLAAQKDTLIKKEDIDKCISAIASGKYTLEDIKSKWNVTKNIENKLINNN